MNGLSHAFPRSTWKSAWTYGNRGNPSIRGISSPHAGNQFGHGRGNPVIRHFQMSSISTPYGGSASDGDLPPAPWAVGAPRGERIAGERLQRELNNIPHAEEAQAIPGLRHAVRPISTRRGKLTLPPLGSCIAPVEQRASRCSVIIRPTPPAVGAGAAVACRSLGLIKPPATKRSSAEAQRAQRAQERVCAKESKGFWAEVYEELVRKPTPREEISDDLEEALRKADVQI